MTTTAAHTPNMVAWGAGRLQIGALPIYFKRAGRSGPTILFLHGWNDSHLVWEPAMAALAEHCRCVAIDLPGYGKSGALPPHCGVQEVAALVGRFLDTLGVEEVVVAGHSYGGMVALRLALDRPALVTKLILVAAAYTGHLPPAMHIMFSMVKRPLVEGARLAWAVAGRAFHPRGKQLAVGQRVMIPPSRTFYHASTWLLQRTLQVMPNAALHAEISLIQQPALVLGGDADEVIPLARSEWLAMRLPYAQLVPLAGAGHYPMLEQCEAFTALVMPFVTAPTPPPPPPSDMSPAVPDHHPAPTT